MILHKNGCNYLDVARFIGIYLVIFAHFMFNYHQKIYPDIIFSFHMPLFYIVSGILHKQGAFSSNKLVTIVVAFIVPYLLYNAFGAIYIYLDKGYSLELGNAIKSTLWGENPITLTSWFLLSLF